MRTSYHLSPDDIIAFTEFHRANSPAMRRQRVGSILTCFAALSILPGFILVTTDKPILQTVAAIWPLLVAPAVFLVLVIPYMKWRAKSLLQHMLTEGDNNGFYGDCTMTLDAVGVHEAKESGDATRKWSSIHKVVITGSHLFIYTSSIDAFVIPRRAFDMSEFDDFVNFINQYSGQEVQYS